MSKKVKEETYYESIKRRDPAARNNWQIFWLYPSVRCLRYYRLAHYFWNHKLKFIAEMLMVIAKKKTGIEIHPGAKIGKNLFIDHGSGVVIGETTIIGNNVTLYHGVTLGGTSLKKEPRHPIVEDNVIIGAGTNIIGRITIGKNSKIGVNLTIRKDVPPNSIIKSQEIISY